jgi:hypothetical protein
VDDREHLGDLLAGGDMSRRHQYVCDADRYRRGDSMGHATEQRLHQVGDGGLAEEADAQGGERDAELAGRQVLGDVVQLLEHEARAAGALLGELLEPLAPRSHQRELRRDEEPVDEHERSDRKEQEGGHRQPWRSAQPGCRPRLRGRSSIIDWTGKR